VSIGDLACTPAGRVKLAVNEIVAAGDYRLVRTVKRLAHPERVR
jgi:hypothetical protein